MHIQNECLPNTVFVGAVLLLAVVPLGQLLDEQSDALAHLVELQIEVRQLRQLAGRLLKESVNSKLPSYLYAPPRWRSWSP